MQSYLFVPPWGRLSCSTYPQGWPVLCLYQNVFLILHLISVAMRKYPYSDQKKIRGGKKGTLSFLRELRNSSGNWSRNHGGMQLAGYLSGSCSGNFLTQFRVTCLGSGAAHSGLDLYQLAIGTVPHRHPTDQSDKDTELRLFSGVLVCRLES